GNPGVSLSIVSPTNSEPAPPTTKRRVVPLASARVDRPSSQIRWSPPVRLGPVVDTMTSWASAMRASNSASAISPASELAAPGTSVPERVMAVTSIPREAASAVTREPIIPDAPKSAIFIFFLSRLAEAMPDERRVLTDSQYLCEIEYLKDTIGL